MTSQLTDGCREFDERLIDLAVEPIAELEVEAHLATCERCRTALDQYSWTGRAIQAALTTLGGPRPALPPDRSRTPLPLTLAASLLLTAAAFALATFPSVNQDLPGISVHAEEGAVVQHLGPDRVRIEGGVSMFVIRDPYSVVETPVGNLTCSSCEFTVYVDECHDMADLPRELCGLGGLCVMVSVSAGTVGTTVADRLVSMGPGQIMTWPVIDPRTGQ